MTREKFIGFSIAAFISVIALVGYINDRVNTVYMNGMEFEHVGMMERTLEDGNTIYMPIYRRK